MNIAVIERMISQADMSLDALRYLVSCRTETEWLDYKEELHLNSDAAAAGFARDVLGMKNVGGGYVVVGVQDKTWRPIGIHAPLPYDSKLLRDAVRKCCGLDLEVDIVHHNAFGDVGTGRFALILVRGSSRRKKRRAPSVVSKDFHPKESFGFRRGDIYIRRGDSTVRIQSQAELEDVLERLEAVADESAIAAAAPSLPFAVLDGTYRLLEKGYDSFIGRTNLRNEVLKTITKDPRIWIIDVHGPGGVGKSALVNWAVYDFYEHRRFEAILHLSAKDAKLTAQGIQQSPRSLYSLENLLDHIIDLFAEPVPDGLDGKRRLAVELLDAWSTLIVLDNMETVQDGRILKFVQELPPSTKTKVLLTSRQKTGGWELPIPVNELSSEEVREFVEVKSAEMDVIFPLDHDICERVRQATGGLPLAIQWAIGRFKITHNLTKVLGAVGDKDSPILEFSFRNIWNLLSPDAKAALAVMTIFDSPPDIQQISIATDWGIDRIDKALSELSDVTLVTPNTQVSDGKTVYLGLPITLSFARNQLEGMGDFEVTCRQRVQKFREQMELQSWEVQAFTSTFTKYALSTENERRAAILCRRAESEIFSGNVAMAEMLLKQARNLVPTSAYVLAMSASGELATGNVGEALELIRQAESRITKSTGALVYSILARIQDAQHDRGARVAALQKAVEYEPDNAVLRHQLGVALSLYGRPEEAIDEFTKIIDAEKKKPHPTGTLLVALRTRILNLRRLSRNEEANADLELAKQFYGRYPHLQNDPWFAEEDLGIAGHADAT